MYFYHIVYHTLNAFKIVNGGGKVLIKKYMIMLKHIHFSKTI